LLIKSSSGGNSFNDFQAFHFNKRTVNFYHKLGIFCKPVWWNATVSPLFTIPLGPDIIWETVSNKNIWGKGIPVFPLNYTTVHHWL